MLIFLVSCGIESGDGKNSSFSFQLGVNCSSPSATPAGSATNCIQATDGANIRAYIMLDTCSTLFDTSASSAEVSSAISNSRAVGSGTVDCSSTVCSSTIETWSAVEETGSVTVFTITDHNKNSIFGESGEVFSCEDAIPFNNRGSDLMNETSVSISFSDVI